MLLHSNDLPVRILGTGPVAQEIRDYVMEQGLDAHCMSFNQAQNDADADCYQYIIGTARQTAVRVQASQWLQYHQYNSPSIIHPQANVKNPEKIGQGVVCYPFSLVLDADIGHHVFLAPFCHVGHLSQVALGTVFLPYSFLLGAASIQGCFSVLQTRASVLDFIKISADYVNILAGAMVTKHLNDTGTYGGTPARKVNNDSTLTAGYFSRQPNTVAERP